MRQPSFTMEPGHPDRNRRVRNTQGSDAPMHQFLVYLVYQANTLQRENPIGLIDAVLMRREESKESEPSLCSQPASP